MKNTKTPLTTLRITQITHVKVQKYLQIQTLFFFLRPDTYFNYT